MRGAPRRHPQPFAPRRGRLRTSAIDVAVTDGDAVLTGAVRRRSDADILPRLIRLIPGVVDVRSELTWSERD
jgi:osmotically-inducible protein OsmY